MMQKTEIQVNDFGGAPVAEHNQLCHVCWVNPANLLLNTGVFQPCEDCQRAGWATVRVPGRFLEGLVKPMMWRKRR